MEPLRNELRTRSMERVDIINLNVFRRPDNTSNNKKRFITDYYER